MMEKIEKKMKEDLTERYLNLGAQITAVFVLFIFTVFILAFSKEYYRDIMYVKYRLYYVSTIAMVVAFLIMVVGFLLKEYKEKKSIGVKIGFCKHSFKEFLKMIPTPLLAMIIFEIAVVISTFMSDYFYESFWGNEGRLGGLFLTTLYVVSSLLISRFLRPKQWYLDAFLFAGVLMCLFGITDYFQMDILHFQVGIVEEQRGKFTSTIGNINSYTAMVGMIFAVAATLFGVEKNGYRTIWYFMVSIIAIAGLITGLSDNAYLTMGALFAFLPLYLFKNRRGVRRYAVLVAGSLSVSCWIQYVNIVMPESVLEIGGIFQFIIECDKLLYITAGIWAVIAAWYVIEWKSGELETTLSKWPRIIWGGIIAIVALMILFILYDANVVGHSERYGAVSQYVVFNDEWGTLRGFVWRIGLEAYNELPILQKIFGYGPECFGILTYNIRAESVSNYGVVYDNAHNEYLQYLVTIGIAGLVAYLAMILLAIKEMLKEGINKPFVAAAAFAVICYSFQAVVNLAMPMITPVMWVLLAVGLSGCRKEKNCQK